MLIASIPRAARKNDGVGMSIVEGAEVALVSTPGEIQVPPAAAEPEGIKFVAVHLKQILLGTLTKDVGELVLSKYGRKVDEFCHGAVR